MTNNLSIPQKSQSVEKILIIGCGDIGQRLAKKLAPHHHHITGIRRHCPPDTPFLHYETCDTGNTEALKDVLQQGYDIIVITMTPGERSDEGYKHAYVRTCENLVGALKALHQQPLLIIFVSSTAVYAQDDGSQVDEYSPTEPVHFSGKRLLEAETVIRTSGFPNTSVRFSGIYGPGRTRLIEQVKQGRASGSTGYTNRIHAEDCAGFLAHLIHYQKPLAPIYIATDSNPTPMVEVVSWIAGQLGINDFLSSTTTNERGNKKLSNKLLQETGYQLEYQNFRQGYAEMLQQK